MRQRERDYLLILAVAVFALAMTAEAYAGKIIGNG